MRLRAGAQSQSRERKSLRRGAGRGGERGRADKAVEEDLERALLGAQLAALAPLALEVDPVVEEGRAREHGDLGARDDVRPERAVDDGGGRLAEERLAGEEARAAERDDGRQEVAVDPLAELGIERAVGLLVGGLEDAERAAGAVAREVRAARALAVEPRLDAGLDGETYLLDESVCGLGVSRCRRTR